MSYALTVPIQVHTWSEGASDGYGGTTDAYTPAEDEPGTEHLVFAIYTGASNEPRLVNHDRVITDGAVIGPPGIAGPHDLIKHTRLGKFQVDGEPEDYNDNPWWSPGLVVYNLKRVEG